MYKYTIGFFGDSFCSDVKDSHSVRYQYETFIKKLEKHYNAKIVSLGMGGSSVWDTLLIQLDPFLKNTPPDICIFVWTTHGRLFNRTVRDINTNSSMTARSKLRYILKPKVLKIWEAAKWYFDYLQDWEKDKIEWEALLRYIDQVVLAKIPHTTKIVHLWTAGMPDEWTKKEINNSMYPLEFSRGAEIRPNLTALSIYDQDIDILGNDPRCNHLDGEIKNTMLFNWIQTAIDNPDQLWDYSADIDKLNNFPIADIEKYNGKP
jgi:hypothetical protein